MSSMSDGNFTNKEILLKLLDDMREVRDNQIRQTEKLVEIEGHAKFTNGKIAKAISDIDRLESTIYSEDRKQTKMLIRYGLMALVLSAFIFIQESRDFLLQFLNII